MLTTNKANLHTLTCDHCWNHTESKRMSLLLYNAQKEGWYGGKIVGNIAHVGSLYNEDCKLHFCSLECAKQYRHK